MANLITEKQKKKIFGQYEKSFDIAPTFCTQDSFTLGAELINSG